METTEINKEELELIQQRSDQWRLERMGRMTSSEHHRLVADCKRDMTQEELANRPPKSTAKTIADPTLLSEGAITYIEEVATEILTGQSADDERTTKEMEWGILYEPQAVKMYERVSQVVVTETGSLKYPALPKYVSGSPDGLIGEYGGLEIKCPYNNVHHLKNIRMRDWQDLKKLRPTYYWQVISGLLITGRKYWDFMSYSPNYPLRLQVGIVRIKYEDVQEDVRHLAIKLKFAVRELENILEQFQEEE